MFNNGATIELNNKWDFQHGYIHIYVSKWNFQHVLYSVSYNLQMMWANEFPALSFYNLHFQRILKIRKEKNVHFLLHKNTRTIECIFPWQSSWECLKIYISWNFIWKLLVDALSWFIDYVLWYMCCVIYESPDDI